MYPDSKHSWKHSAIPFEHTQHSLYPACWNEFWSSTENTTTWQSMYPDSKHSWKHSAIPYEHTQHSLYPAQWKEFLSSTKKATMWQSMYPDSKHSWKHSAIPCGLIYPSQSLNSDSRYSWKISAYPFLCTVKTKPLCHTQTERVHLIPGTPATNTAHRSPVKIKNPNSKNSPNNCNGKQKVMFLPSPQTLNPVQGKHPHFGMQVWVCFAGFRVWIFTVNVFQECSDFLCQTLL